MATNDTDVGYNGQFNRENANQLTAYCPGCGTKLVEASYEYLQQESACPLCHLHWLILWDYDENGGWAVQAYQCNNADRTTQGRTMAGPVGP